MKRIYIAAPMFSYAELNYNEMIANKLQSANFDVFLPQRSGYKLVELMREMTPNKARETIFEKDIKEVEKSDIIVVVLDGRTIDEGACVELGYGYALGKICYGLKTDPRTMMNGQINPMISECLNSILSSVDELISVLKEN